MPKPSPAKHEVEFQEAMKRAVKAEKSDKKKVRPLPNPKKGKREPGE